MWVGAGGCDLSVGRCGLVWVGGPINGSMWVGVTFLWVGVARCGSVVIGAQNDITGKTSVSLFMRLYD